MKLRFQNLIIILPIFFILAGVLTSFNYYIQKKELMHGLKEEINSISVSTSIFLQHKNDIIESKDKIKRSFDRILYYEIVKRILLVNPDGIIIQSIDEDLKESNNFEYKKTKLLKIYTENDHVLFSNLTSIEGTKYQLYITIDAQYIKTALDDGKEEALINIAIILLLGFVVSSILTSVTNKNILELNKIAKAIGTGDYNENIKHFFIKEINDLSNTLNVVQSILKEMLVNTKNSILDNDFFINDEELKKLNSMNEYSSKIKIDNTWFSIAVLNNLNKKEFYCCWSNKNSMYAFVGEINTNNDDIKDHICASSLTHMIKFYLNNNSCDLEKINKMYDIKTLLILKYDQESKKLEEQRISNGKISSENKIVEKESSFSFYHNENADLKLRNYIEKYRHLDSDELIEDLKSIFEKENSVLLVKI